MLRKAIPIVFLVYLVLSPNHVTAKNLSKEEIYNEALKYTVFIKTEGSNMNFDFIIPIASHFGEKLNAGSATGIVVKDENGKPLIITKSHVVPSEGSDEKDQIFYVWFYGNRQYESVRKIGYDKKFDWAILKFVDENFQPPGFATLGSNTNTRVGDETFFIFGNPIRLKYFFIEAELSSKSVEHYTTSYKPMAFDANCTNGFSGGPVINGSGEVVGLVEFILITENSPCFVSPIEIFEQLYTALKKGGEVKHGTLGLDVANLHEFTPGELKWLRAKGDGGVGIICVTPRSEADKVGVKPGDIIVSISRPGNVGQFEIGDVASLSEKLHLNFFPEDKIVLEIKRGDKMLTKTVTMRKIRKSTPIDS